MTPFELELKVFEFCSRLHASVMQEPLPAASVQEDRRGPLVVAERAESQLRCHLPDSLDPAALHASIRLLAAGL